MIFLTFGDGSYSFRCAAKRIALEALKLSIFDKAIFYNFKKLQNEHPNFWKKNRDFILNNRRGAGYWIWKSFIVQEILKKLEEGDLLFYCDAGCEIDKTLIQTIDQVLPKNCDITLFEIKDHTNEAWTNY
jgi:hypothetical protein